MKVPFASGNARGATAVLSCGHSRWVSKFESVGEKVACADCGYAWKGIVSLEPEAEETHG